MTQSIVEYWQGEWLAGNISRKEMEEQIIMAQRFAAKGPAMSEPKLSPSERAERFQTRTKVHEAAFAKSDGRCFYCGAEGKRTIEHKIPKFRGGRNNAENCVVACSTCNGRKHTRTPEEFKIHMMLKYGRAPTPFFGEPKGPDRDWLIVTVPPPQPSVIERRESIKMRRFGREGEAALRVRGHLGDLEDQRPS